MGRESLAVKDMFVAFLVFISQLNSFLQFFFNFNSNNKFKTHIEFWRQNSRQLIILTWFQSDLVWLTMLTLEDGSLSSVHFLTTSMLKIIFSILSWQMVINPSIPSQCFKTCGSKHWVTSFPPQIPVSRSSLKKPEQLIPFKHKQGRFLSKVFKPNVVVIQVRFRAKLILNSF